MAEAVEPDLEAYPHLQALFTRHLRPGARPVAPAAALVSPADCAVLYFGKADAGTAEQVKGLSYPLATLLGEPVPTPRPGNALFHCILYLAPGARGGAAGSRASLSVSPSQHQGAVWGCVAGDYHHYHSPADWQGTVARHFPGDLLSVSPMVARAVPGLFNYNERVTVAGQWAHGFFAFVAVGAYNVGSIGLDALPVRVRCVCVCAWTWWGWRRRGRTLDRG